MKYLISLIVIIILMIGMVGCSPADPITEDFYTEGAIYVRVGGEWVALENADFNRWEDLRTPVSAVKLSGVKPPTWTEYKSSRVLAFSDQAVVGNEEIIYFALQMPHSYKEGSTVYPHVHWVPEDNTGGNVRWALTYTWANEDDTFGAATTLYINASAGTTTDIHLESSFAPIMGSGKTISSMILCSLKRNSSDALDTYNGKDAYLLEVDFHYLSDAMGSRWEDNIK